MVDCPVMSKATSERPLGVLRFELTLASPKQALSIHLLEVAQQCNEALLQPTSRPARRVAVCAALTHDLGKALSRYQRWVRSEEDGETVPVTVADCGAVWSWWLSRRLVLWERVAATAAVLAHHGQLEHEPTKQLLQLSRQTRNARRLRRQLGTMDLPGAGQFVVDTGSRFLLPVPTRAPARQQLLEAMPGELQLAALRHGDLERIDQFLEQHLELLQPANS